MKAKPRIPTGALHSSGVIFFSLLATASYGQTLLNLGSQGRNADFTNFPYTRPLKTGASLPSSCAVGDMFFNTAAPAGRNLYTCLTANSWVQQVGLADPGTNGIVTRTGLNATAVIAAPLSSLVGVSDVQTLTNKSLDASEITSGVIASSRIPSLTGDITTASGSTLSTLATVNNSPGTYGDSTHSLQATVDGKGRITSLTPILISSTGSSGSGFYQQLSKSGVAITQRPSLNLSGAFTVSDNSAASRTDIDLVQVNSNPGTFGSATQVPVLTVNSYGQITNVSTAATSGGSSGNSLNSAAGTFASIPASCTVGSLYLASDQPIGQQLYTCSAANSWSQLLSVGPSGALAIIGGSLDIATSVVPRLAAANSFTGSNSFAGTTTLNNVTISGTCTGCANSGGFTNPMSHLGSLIAGGTGGAPQELLAGASGQGLIMGSDGQPHWGSFNNFPQITTDTDGSIQITGAKDGTADLFVQGANAANLYLRSADGVGAWFLSSYPAAYNQTPGYFGFFNAANGKTPVELPVEANTLKLVGDSAANIPACNAMHRGALFFVQGASGAADGLQVCAQNASGTLAWHVVF